MNRYFRMKKTMFSIFFVMILGSVLFAQSDDRYFDGLDKKSNVLTLTILYPSRGTLRSLQGLQEEGFFPSEDIIVVGAYHEKELTDYDASVDLADEKKLDWLRFHEIRGDIHKDNLFQKNDCTLDFEKIFRYSDGIIFFGGADIPPEIYGKKTNLLTGIRTPYRHYMELSFIFHLLGGYQDDHFQGLVASRPDFPVLCICLGEQTLNIGTGGTLIQDVWFEKYGKTFVEDVVDLGKENWHNNPWARLYPQEEFLWFNMHRIKLHEEGMFVNAMGFSTSDTPYIISSHHQAVDDLGKGMKVVATSMDGKIVEAIQHDKYPNVLGIQFHPEFYALWETEKKCRITPDDEKFSLKQFLKDNPPTYKFHAKIWEWFVGRIKEQHDR